MAKANLKFSRIGNDGYDYARREDGVWFVREGYYGRYGWAKTKWTQVQPGDGMTIVDACLKAYEAGSSSTYVGFGNLVVFSDGKGLRLP
ncbi:hypothetical protein 20Sep418_00104 [Pseudomonas phage 20Sep418]|uniref:Uncharacterized protein n=4 Tax=Pakpunavirus TaxID=1921407 RepID=A0AAF0JR42_9CAUD|nr:hypothetical protein QE331_gp057 [Pseudomonas phage 20Sep416]YP_010764661.1 hypothetical protein QE344_gp123 [Pseudomonas phage vB_PaeM_B55]WFG37779.1 hypothetical protein 20Sep418_00104 [Pseudomonas phage 20Sep418]WFP46055.1 hypothetical protein VIPPAEUMC01_00121 [Pseudomonas phage vB_VIPPAEUMC01]WBY51928.1 hypothetical protein PB55_76 [Pseudomonas phage vB_PaeM_B55]WFG37552.1 hypothetical protein 20Sep416_00057 [Pseudomonas phage 20Sep416]